MPLAQKIFTSAARAMLIDVEASTAQKIAAALTAGNFLIMASSLLACERIGISRMQVAA
jgi:hypothetical protein